MPVRRSSRTQVPDQQIELIGTGSVGPVWSGQHLEHNAQRQKPLRALLLHSAITIEGKKNFTPHIPKKISRNIYRLWPTMGPTRHLGLRDVAYALDYPPIHYVRTR